MLYLSILFFIISPLFSIPILVLGIITDVKHRKWILLILAVVIGIFSYYIIPTEGIDLYVYFQRMQNFGNMDIIQLMEYLFNNTEPLFSIIFFIIGKTENFSLLSMVCTIYVYALMFYMIDDYSKKKELSNIKTAFVILFFITTFNYAQFASGLRNIVAIVTYIFIIYLEFIKEKKKIQYKLLYIVPCLLHKSLFVAVLFRILLCFNYKKIRKYYIVIMIIFCISNSLIIQVTGILSNLPIFSTLLDKAEMYTNDESSIFSNALNLSRFLNVLFTYMIVLYTRRKYMKGENLKFYNFIDMTNIFAIATCSYFHMFSRFSMLAVFVNLFAIIDFLRKEKSQAKLFFASSILVFLICISMVGQSATFKNRNFGDLFTNGWTRNAITIFLDKGERE